VFISIGGPLTGAGPLGLLIGVSIWAFVVWVSPPPIGFRHGIGLTLSASQTASSRWPPSCPCPEDSSTTAVVSWTPARGSPLDGMFSCSWTPVVRAVALTIRNYVIQGIAFVCFELTAFNVLVSYWAPNLNPAICISAGLVALGLANGINVRLYGEIGVYTVAHSVPLAYRQSSGSPSSRSSSSSACSSSRSSRCWVGTPCTTDTASDTGRTPVCSLRTTSSAA
jgi:hypothetical protein